MTAIIVAFLMSLLWYFVDSRKNSKQTVSQPVPNDQDIIRQDDLTVYNEKSSKNQPIKSLQQESAGRLYYSTPGKTYSCFVRSGRVLNTGKAWPYPPNRP
ncbi:hypothetical protein [Spirosoma lituiforme]